MLTNRIAANKKIDFFFETPEDEILESIRVMLIAISGT